MRPALTGTAGKRPASRSKDGEQFTKNQGRSGQTDKLYVLTGFPRWLLQRVQRSAKFMAIQASIIVPTRNRSSELASCLASLAQQSLAADAFEVIVVDNASEDATKEVVTRAVGAFPKHN